MKHKKGFAAVLLTLIISALLSVSAFAASDSFPDVPEASPFYESVTYLARHGITYGTGNGRYAPDTPITVRQWATMLCRVLDKEDSLADPAGYGGDACIKQGYADGWLNLTAMAAPGSRPAPFFYWVLKKFIHSFVFYSPGNYDIIGKIGLVWPFVFQRRLFHGIFHQTVRKSFRPGNQTHPAHS